MINYSYETDFKVVIFHRPDYKRAYVLYIDGRGYDYLYDDYSIVWDTIL